MSPFELVANITLKSKYISLNVATAMTTASPSTEASSNDSGVGGGGGSEEESTTAKSYRARSARKKILHCIPYTCMRDIILKYA